MQEKVKMFKQIVNEMAELYEKKNSNYGDSFGQLFDALGPVAGLVPLHNKLDRATSLVKGDKNNFESLEDTFKDLACYAIMNLIEMKRKEVKPITVIGDSINDPFKKLEDYTITTPGVVYPVITTLPYRSSNPCYKCAWYNSEQYKGIYVGDTPCQWCQHGTQVICGSTTACNRTVEVYDNNDANICTSTDGIKVRATGSNGLEDAFVKADPSIVASTMIDEHRDNNDLAVKPTMYANTKDYITASTDLTKEIYTLPTIK